MRSSKARSGRLTSTAISIAWALAACGDQKHGPYLDAPPADATACTQFTTQLPFPIAPTLTWVGDGWAMVTLPASGDASYVHVSMDGTVSTPVPIAGLAPGGYSEQLVWANQRIYTVLSTPAALASFTVDGQDLRVGSDLGITPLGGPTLASTVAGFTIAASDWPHPPGLIAVLTVDGDGVLVTKRSLSPPVSGDFSMCLDDSGSRLMTAAAGTFCTIYVTELSPNGTSTTLEPQVVNPGNCGIASDSGHTLATTQSHAWSLDGSAATPEPFRNVLAVAPDPPGFAMLVSNDVTVMRFDENLVVQRTPALARGTIGVDGALGVGPDCLLVSYATTEGGPATLVQLPR